MIGSDRTCEVAQRRPTPSGESLMSRLVHEVFRSWPQVPLWEIEVLSGSSALWTMATIQSTCKKPANFAAPAPGSPFSNVASKPPIISTSRLDGVPGHLPDRPHPFVLLEFTIPGNKRNTLGQRNRYQGTIERILVMRRKAKHSQGMRGGEGQHRQAQVVHQGFKMLPGERC